MSSSAPSPSRSTTPGRKFWTNTSAVGDKRRTTSAPASVDRSTAIDRLPRFRLAKYALIPPRPVPTGESDRRSGVRPSPRRHPDRRAPSWRVGRTCCSSDRHARVPSSGRKPVSGMSRHYDETRKGFAALRGFRLADVAGYTMTRSPCIDHPLLTNQRFTGDMTAKIRTSKAAWIVLAAALSIVAGCSIGTPTESSPPLHRQ